MKTTIVANLHVVSLMKCNSVEYLTRTSRIARYRYGYGTRPKCSMASPAADAHLGS